MIPWLQPVNGWSICAISTSLLNSSMRSPQLFQKQLSRERVGDKEKDTNNVDREISVARESLSAKL